MSLQPSDPSLSPQAGGEPAVSVVMAVYNGEKYLAEAVASILEQTFGDFEFVVIDDGSTDGTAAILADFAAKDSRLRVFPQENAGLTRSLVRGVELARAPLIARMDADDISCPTRLEKQVRFLQSHPEVALVSSQIEFMDDAGTKRFDVDPLHFPPGCVSFFMPFFNVTAGHGQVMYTRSLYDRAGGYDPAFRFAQDYDLWERMSHHTEFGQVDEVLYRFRTSADSITKKNWGAQQECRSRVSVRSYRHLTGQTLDPDTLRVVNEFWHGTQLGALDASELRRIEEAQRCALRAWKGKPRSRAEQAAVNLKVAEQYAKHGARIPIRRLPLAMVFHMLAAKWSIPTFVRAVRERLGRSRFMG